MMMFGTKVTTFDEIIEKYVEMNIVYPFRDGNGRSPIRDIEIKCILKQALTFKNNMYQKRKEFDTCYFYICMGEDV